MDRFFSLNSFSMRLLLGFIALVVLTTLSAGAPAFWLTRSQLERQAWSQVENAQNAVRSLLAAEQSRLTDQLALFAERPTLRQLAGQPVTDALQPYLLEFQRRSGLDILLLCDADGRLLAGAGDYTTCTAPDEPGFMVLDRRPAILATQAVTDGDGAGRPLGTAVAGVWLEAPFLERLSAATGLQHSMLRPDGRRLSSNLALAGTMAAVSETAGDEPGQRERITFDGRSYYATYLPLSNSAGEVALISEAGLPVDELIATTRRAFSILAISAAGLALVGSLITFWFIYQVNAPLQRLTAAAEKIGQGDLMAALPLISTPAEIRTLAGALHRSQASMLLALQERSEVGERLNTLLQSIVEGVVTYDAAGLVTFWSEGAHTMLGYSPDEAIHQHVNQLFQLTDDVETPFLDQLPPPGQKKQIGVHARSGRPIVLAITTSQLIPPGGATMQVALVLRDVTEEEAVSRLRSYFLANISHEFRTPLSTLNASVELLMDDQESFSLAEVRQLLKPTHVSLLSLQALIDNLLESSSIEAGRFTLRRRPFHIHEAIESAVNIAQPLLERRSQKLSLTESPQLPEIEGDRARLTQALVNLIINASKYSPIGQPIELQLTQQTDTLYVGVTDRGPGIPPAERGNLFRSFVRLDSGDQEQYGVGLGLFVVKTIVEAHGGRVGVSDRPGGGSRFWFEIPFRQKDAA